MTGRAAASLEQFELTLVGGGQQSRKALIFRIAGEFFGNGRDLDRDDLEILGHRGLRLFREICASRIENIEKLGSGGFELVLVGSQRHQRRTRGEADPGAQGRRGLRMLLRRFPRKTAATRASATTSPDPTASGIHHSALARSSSSSYLRLLPFLSRV